MSRSILIFSFLVSTLCIACQEEEQSTESENKISNQENEQLFIATLEKHLAAVSNRDLETLANTLSPTGEMYLILPQTETMTTTEDFLDYHVTWFRDTAWTFETEILKTAIDDNLGMAIVDVTYSELERNGEPYFNHMQVSYTLRKEGSEWYVYKDHASSIERTGDR
ncbi:MAG: nuclear transport factor 2 family protein [Bacteroidota bacterium]